jgi:hypothetical protein
MSILKVLKLGGRVLLSSVTNAVAKSRGQTAVWRQLLFPVNDNYSSRSATTTSFPAA